MRLHPTSLLGLLAGLLSLTSTLTAAQDSSPEVETHHYASDISKLRNIVVHSLYSHKDVFLRELLSNAQDALEKLRLTSLRDESLKESEGMSGWQGNITIEARKNEDGKGGQLVLRDTGIGMTKEELAQNLGTIAKSGTSDFLKKALDSSASSDSNLIGQFGLGFYSSFLVSPSVRVSSLPPPSKSNPNPEQYTFTSSSTGDDFSIFKDPRGNSLAESGGPCGTEIILEIEEGLDNAWVLDENKLKELVEKHSQFASSFPIYLLSSSSSTASSDDELEEPATQLVAERLNEKGPIWMREPKDVDEEEYKEFYQVMTKDTKEPIAWSHWRGDSGSGVSFRALMYIPSHIPDDFWQNVVTGVKHVRLMVKRVFITDDLGADYLPRWLSFLKVVVDADDLPLNVSRETLQNNRFIRQLQKILVRKALDLFTKLANDDDEQFLQFSKVYGNTLRFGVLETTDKERKKLADLLRFASTERDVVSFEEYVAARKDGQKHIFYLAGTGEAIPELAKSPNAELAIARGYEVLLLNQPADESVMEALRSYGGMKMQDVSRKGFKFGDEDDDAEKAELEMQKKAFKPLITWLKKYLSGPFSDVVISPRLVISPCAVVADNYGYSANMLRYLEAQARGADDEAIRQYARSQRKILEINPKSPLMEGMLERVLELPEMEEGVDSAEEQDLKDLLGVLVDASLVRAGYPVSDNQEYFDRIEALLRRAIGVSLHSKPDINVKPAPPTATGPLPDIIDDDVPSQKIFNMNDLGGSDSDIMDMLANAGVDPTGNDDVEGEFVDWHKLKGMLDDKKAKGEEMPGMGGKEIDEEEVGKLMREAKEWGIKVEDGEVKLTGGAEHDEL